jgi:uncharacterized protein (TIRG00374 family)
VRSTACRCSSTEPSSSGGGARRRRPLPSPAPPCAPPAKPPARLRYTRNPEPAVCASGRSFINRRRKAIVFLVAAAVLAVLFYFFVGEHKTVALPHFLVWPFYGLVVTTILLFLLGRLTKSVRRVVVFILIVFVLYLILPRLIGEGKALEMLRDASWPLLFVAVCLEFVALLGYANLFRHILRVLDLRLGLGTMYSIVLAGLAASHVVGAGGAAGIVVSYNALRKRGAPHGLIFVAIAAQNFFNYIVLWMLFLGAMAWGLLTGGLEPARYSVAILLIGFLLWLTGYGIYLYNRRTKMRRRVAQVAALVNRISHKKRIEQEHIDEWLDHLFAGMRAMSTHRGAKRMALTYSCVFWLFDMMCLYLTFRAFGFHVGFTPLVMSYVVAYAVGSLMPTPGGLGAVETLLITMFIGFGVPSAAATVTVLSYRLINFWLPMIPGFIGYLAIRRPPDRVAA